MTIFINGSSRVVPDEINSVSKLIDYLRISRQGTGVGLNNHLVPARDWDVAAIKNDDRVMIISATFGG